ncbi:transcription/translation regulatory transformer protein RfaH [Marinobacter persicus]|uniref:Transcriptional antiterminator RfaH n=1 Tax=Marinobacter persicus TaxID=930118 RepID=A0A2S6G2H8_9GAMM|nr:transcription/translation regulatory transformer protein RfaH [Marinobacter persicus]PPK49987.1 transcriptional antiterminator RfaH [Marinobacter persicus]PPK51902.1 transcriptional antiterminator RfaH [Marinobacter persicus]PPK56569.1 transcriptional antiterminator RfaH [Marinobacter persicus]
MAWHAVQYKSGQGSRALANLENQNIRCFHPEVPIERIVNRKQVIRSEPLFSGYIFIQMDKDDPSWKKLHSTRGVLRVLSFGGKPGVIPDEVIDYIADTLETVQSAGGLRKGEAVCVREGPFSGLEAIFQSYDGEERAIVLISFMQSQGSG